MRSSPPQPSPSQGRLFAVPDSPPARPAREPVRGRAARMAARIDRAARAAEREAVACRRAGDDVGFRRASEEARSARRAAAMLRGGPDSVEALLDAS
ncbi:MAG: hypothetical protein ACR2N6_04760 [Miltoncostaeaceae bacterium]